MAYKFQLGAKNLAGDLMVVGPVDISSTITTVNLSASSDILADGNVSITNALVSAAAEKTNSDPGYQMRYQNTSGDKIIRIRADKNSPNTGAGRGAQLELFSRQGGSSNGNPRVEVYCGATDGGQLKIRDSDGSTKFAVDGTGMLATYSNVACVGNATINGNCTIDGDLDVGGTLTSLDGESEMEIEDKVIQIDAGNGGNADGAKVIYGSANAANGAAVQFHSSDTALKFFNGDSSGLIPIRARKLIGDGSGLTGTYESGNDPIWPVQSATANANGGAAPTLVKDKMNYVLYTASGQKFVKMAAGATVGDTVRVKFIGSSMSSTNKVTINRQGSDVIDGENTIDIINNQTAIELIYVEANKWAIL